MLLYNKPINKLTNQIITILFPFHVEYAITAMVTLSVFICSHHISPRVYLIECTHFFLPNFSLQKVSVEHVQNVTGSSSYQHRSKKTETKSTWSDARLTMTVVHGQTGRQTVNHPRSDDHFVNMFFHQRKWGYNFLRLLIQQFHQYVLCWYTQQFPGYPG